MLIISTKKLKYYINKKSNWYLCFVGNFAVQMPKVLLSSLRYVDNDPYQINATAIPI